MSKLAGRLAPDPMSRTIARAGGVVFVLELREEGLICVLLISPV
jgi:hypothetical protein